MSADGDKQPTGPVPPVKPTGVTVIATVTGVDARLLEEVIRAALAGLGGTLVECGWAPDMDTVRDVTPGVSDLALLDLNPGQTVRYLVAEFIAGCKARDLDPVEVWREWRTDWSDALGSWFVGPWSDDDVDYFSFELSATLKQCFTCNAPVPGDLVYVGDVGYCPEHATEARAEYGDDA